MASLFLLDSVNVITLSFLLIMCQRERGASREMNGQKARGWAHALMHTDARKLRGQDLILRRSRLCAVKCCRRRLFSIFNYLYFNLPFSSSLKHAVKKALRVSSLLIWDRFGKTCLSSRLPLLLALAPIFNGQARISHLPTPPPLLPSLSHTWSKNIGIFFSIPYRQLWNVYSTGILLACGENRVFVHSVS